MLAGLVAILALSGYNFTEESMYSEQGNPNLSEKASALRNTKFLWKRTGGVYFKQQATLFQEPRKPW